MEVSITHVSGKEKERCDGDAGLGPVVRKVDSAIHWIVIF